MTSVLGIFDKVKRPVLRTYGKIVPSSCGPSGDILTIGGTSIGCTVGGIPGCIIGAGAGKVAHRWVLPTARKIIRKVPILGK